jgi:hypothetical protein
VSVPSASPAPLVFWRETEAGRRGLACSVQFCDNPECACEEALLQAFEVDESFHSLVSRGDRVVVRSLAGATRSSPARRVSAVVDLETGKFPRHRQHSGGPKELSDWLRSAIDERILSELRESWKAYKGELKRERGALGKESWKERDWTKWNGEARIAWSEVLGDPARERYEHQERSYEASDFYCIRPGCPCDSISIRFFEDSGDLLGEVFLDESTAEVVGTGNRAGAHELLLALFDEYESRNDLGSFPRRAEEMARIGPEIHALRREQLRGPIRGKIGRNAPCSCGSGKKYKNCCGR